MSAAAPKSDQSCMTVELQVGERVQIGEATVEMLHKTGRHARVQIRAPRSVPIKRGVGGGAQPVPSMAECEPD